ncbi:MAG: NAD-dependent epimerase/dehydratase family protein [Bacteroidia bacterium]|nr:NAD-dependent epimerase/dehydratase family protein [Bacteroidia bacterium]
MQTILGANGSVAHFTAKALTQFTKHIRLVSRNPVKVNANDELFAADLRQPHQVLNAVAGSDVVFLLVGLPYHTETWAKDWPLIMTNVIEACKVHQAKLVFLDNVYALGDTQTWMTEETAFNPCTKKGEIRAQIATQLLSEMQAGNIEAIIARSADFYGPHTPNSFTTSMIFDRFAKGKSAQWMINDSYKHSFTYTPDAGLACAILGNCPSACNQTLNFPTHKDVFTGKVFIQYAAIATPCVERHQVLTKWMLQTVAWFNPLAKENMEMLYQFEHDYLFSSEKFEKAFRFEPTSYKKGILDTANEAIKRI